MSVKFKNIHVLFKNIYMLPNIYVVQAMYVEWQGAFGGEDSDSDMDMEDDYVHLHCSFFLLFSLFLSDALALSCCFSFSLCLFFGLSLSHTQIYITRFWMGGWVLRGMPRSKGCEFLDFSWLKALSLQVS